MSTFAGGVPAPRRPGSGGGSGASGGSFKAPGWLKDRRVQLGIGGAAVLGLVVFLRRGAGGSGVDAGSGSTPQSVTPAVMDSSGTDIYNAISSLGQGWENDLRDYSQTLDSVQTQLATNTAGLSTLTTQVGKLGPVKAPASTVKPPLLDKTLKTGQGFAILKAGDTKETIAKKYGITTAQLATLNPGGLLSHLGVGEAVRVRAAAGPAPKSKSGTTLWR